MFVCAEAVERPSGPSRTASGDGQETETGNGSGTSLVMTPSPKPPRNLPWEAAATAGTTEEEFVCLFVSLFVCLFVSLLNV